MAGGKETHELKKFRVGGSKKELVICDIEGVWSPSCALVY